MAWLLKTFRGEMLPIPGRDLALAFCLFLCVLPLITKEPFILRVVTFASIYAIFAASWDLLSGFTGQINLGHALFFGVAGYTSALLNYHYGLPLWATIPIGAVAAVGAGLIAGIPALRLRGIYLALATLAYPIVMVGVVNAFPGITGGEMGISGIDPLSTSRVTAYYIALLAMGVSVFIMWKLVDVKSKIVRTGILLQAIREDEISARVSGIHTVKYKLFAFGLSGFFAGIAGGLYVHTMRVAGPSTFELMTSLNPVIWTVFGGMGTIYGAVAGAYILYPAMESLRLAGEIRMLAYALLIVCVLLFMPEGIAVWFRDKTEVVCPRCKLVNAAFRRNCRACGAALHLEK